ncbi:VanZ family protein [Lactococcus garvieae]|uniref:Protein VanZ n=1 Tax=Lactococcus garvieae DCC43 TaxID=1231377 RepID=K2PPA8_9LACT|nr:VanZ family protein [Lactococcus garvieae]EKF52084.1 Protein VanZ [Lactococcus garvieae DCC43]
MHKFSKIIFSYYLFFLFWGILFKFNITDTISVAQHFPTYSLNLSPFNASGGRLEVIFNILIFIPFGYYLSVLSDKKSFLGKVSTIFFISLLVEVLQFIFGIGASDITDIITNTSGGLLGLLLFQTVKRTKAGQDFINILIACVLAFSTFLLLSH